MVPNFLYGMHQPIFAMQTNFNSPVCIFQAVVCSIAKMNQICLCVNGPLSFYIQPMSQQVVNESRVGPP